MTQKRKCIFRLSDLFLVVGFVPMAFFLMWAQDYMQFPDPNMANAKPAIFVPMFLLLLVSWSIYIYLEHDKKHYINRYAIYITVFLIITGLIAILTQAKEFILDTYDIAGNPKTVSVILSDTHILFFAMCTIAVCLFVYIGVFIFPTRFNSKWLIKIFGYLVFAVCFALATYSYMFEINKFLPFIKALGDLDKNAIFSNITVSFTPNANTVGMLYLVGMIFCFINHSLTKRRWLNWIYWPLSIYFFSMMIFSYCRTSIVIGPTIMIIYIYYVLLHTFKKHKVVNTIFLILETLVLLAGVTVFLLSILSKGQYIKYINDFYEMFTDDTSMKSRERIWNNTYQIIAQTQPLSLIFGRGFGTMNVMLLAMNDFKKQLYPTHNGFLNLLAEGGFIYLFAYLVLLGYITARLIRNYNKNGKAVIAIALGMYSFIIYSLNETIHYFTYPFMFLILVLDRALNKKEEKENTNQ